MGGAEHWATGGHPDRPDEWTALLSATHLPWRTDVTGPRSAFAAWAHRWWIDDLALVDCGCAPCSGSRGEREIARTEGEFAVVLMTLAGRETVEQGGRTGHLRPGDAVVWDSTAPARFAVREPLRKRSLLVPRAALDEVGGRGWLRTGAVVDGDAPAVRLLRTYLDTLRTTLPDLGPAATRAARNATLELLAGALRADAATPEGGSAGPALRAAMERWIDRHLADAALGPGALARAHGVSVRTVHRVFQATGETVGEVVRARRLARARADLAGSAATVTAIAHRWGFADGSHFSRAFKAHYGHSPSAARRAGAPAPGGGTHVQAPR